MSKNHIAPFTAKERRICEDTVCQLGGASQKSSQDETCILDPSHNLPHHALEQRLVFG